MPPPLRDVAAQTDTNGPCTMFEITMTVWQNVQHCNIFKHSFLQSICDMLIIYLFIS